MSVHYVSGLRIPRALICEHNDAKQRKKDLQYLLPIAHGSRYAALMKANYKKLDLPASTSVNRWPVLAILVCNKIAVFVSRQMNKNL